MLTHVLPPISTSRFSHLCRRCPAAPFPHRCLAAFPAMSLVPVAPLYLARSRSARPLPSRLFRPCRSSQSLHSTLQRTRSDRYSSLLGQCLRLVSYATGTLSHLRLRAFHRRSSLPSLCYRIASNCVAALYCETPAANDHHGRGGVKRSRLLDLLSLTKTR